MRLLKKSILISASAIWLFLPLGALGQNTPAQTGQQAGQQEGGQQGQPQPPISAEESAQGPEGNQTSAVPGDARSFGGAEGFTVSGPVGSRGYFIPSIQFFESGDSNFAFGTGPQTFETVESVVGRLDYQRGGRRQQTTFEYLGGATIFNHHSGLNTTMHQLGITQTYQGRRWSLTLDDRGSYLPESSFGYGGFGFSGGLGIGLGGALGTNLSGLNPSLNPTTDLLNGRGSRIFNTTVVQIQYLAGERSALKIAASYGFLHFSSSSLLNSRNGNVMVGYSHSFTARDYFGLDYTFGEFRFPGSGTSFNTHNVQASYGHRISGRMAMAVGAGPLVNTFNSVTAGSKSSLSWSAHSSLDYRARRGALAGSYYHYTTNGGGVLLGASTDNVSLSWSTQLMRRWGCSLGPGFARNRSIQQTAGHSQSTFDSEFAHASLSRLIGRNTSLFFMYTYQTQSSNGSACPSGTCGISLQRHMVEMGFDFHPRQLTVD